MGVGRQPPSECGYPGQSAGEDHQKEPERAHDAVKKVNGCGRYPLVDTFGLISPASDPRRCLRYVRRAGGHKLAPERAQRLPQQAQRLPGIAALGLVTPDITVRNAAAPESTLKLLVLALGAGAVVLLPFLLYLFQIFKGQEGR